MMLLALDTSTRTGFASGRPGEQPAWGTRHFGDGRSNGEVVAVFRQWLNQRCYDLKPTLIVFEAPYIPHATATPGRAPINALTLRRLLALTETVCAVAWELRVECREVTTGEACKFMTGKARWRDRDEKKLKVIEACAGYGWDVGGSDDASDALAIWALAEAVLDPAAAELRAINNPAKSSLFAETKSAPRSANRRALKSQSDVGGVNGRQQAFSIF